MLNRKRRTGDSPDRSGIAATEFAVVAPLFIALVLGILEFGQGFDHAVQVTAAIREGGRLASMNFAEVIPEGKTANQKVESDIRSVLEIGGMDTSQLSISITHADGWEEGQSFDLEDPENYLQ